MVFKREAAIANILLLEPFIYRGIFDQNMHLCAARLADSRRPRRRVIHELPAGAEELVASFCYNLNH